VKHVLIYTVSTAELAIEGEVPSETVTITVLPRTSQVKADFS